MLFPKNMKKIGPISPPPSLYHIGSKFFVKNGCKTPKFLACSTNCNTILQFLQGTLGTMKRFTTKVVCIFASNHNLNPQCFMNYMSHPQLGIQGLPKPMNGSNVLFSGMVWNKTFIILCLNVMFVHATREKQSNLLAHYNCFQFHLLFVGISLWILF